MLISNIKFKIFRVTYSELGSLDSTKKLENQLDELKEDLLQLEFEDKIIDVGWYPEFDQDGEFIILAIRNQDWESPLTKETAKSIEAMITCVQKLIDQFSNN